MIDNIIDKIILVRALNYDASFKFTRKKGGMLSVYNCNKVVWIYPYPNVLSQSYVRKVLTDYFGNSIIRN